MNIEIVEHLRRQREGMLRKGEFAIINRDEINDLLSVIDSLRAERDDARQFVCRRDYLLNGLTVTPQEIAKIRGWNCFKVEA